MVAIPLRVFGNEPMTAMEIAALLEARAAAGEGVLLPDADAELVRHAGTIDLAKGDWPEAFLSHAGETICVAVSPFNGGYEFFDESGECFFTLVPVLTTTENWVAPFRENPPEGTVQIRRSGAANEWMTLGVESDLDPWTARIAGRFDLRGIVSCGSFALTTAVQQIEVQLAWKGDPPHENKTLWIHACGRGVFCRRDACALL